MDDAKSERTDGCRSNHQARRIRQLGLGLGCPQKRESRPGQPGTCFAPEITKTTATTSMAAMASRRHLKRGPQSAGPVFPNFIPAPSTLDVPEVPERKHTLSSVGCCLRGSRHDFTALFPSLTGPAGSAGSAGSPARSRCAVCWQTPHWELNTLDNGTGTNVVQHSTPVN